MLNVNLDFDKHIQNFSSGLGDWHKARMAVVNQQITVHKIRCDIINTTGPISHISHDDNAQVYLIDLQTESLKDVRDDTCVQHETLWELQGYSEAFPMKLVSSLLNAIKSFEDLKVVMGGQDAYGMFDINVLRVMLRDSCDELFYLFGLLLMFFLWPKLKLFIVGWL